MRSENWRSIGVVLMFNGEAVFSAKQGAANDPTEPPTRLEPAGFLALLERPKPDDDPQTAV
jgi:hypothetical protein